MFRLKLSDRDREIALARGKGETLQAIGYRFGLTRERVRQIVDRVSAIRNYERYCDERNSRTQFQPPE
jgi:DNA-directed RNA polymerase sigma subunit (sigma70/sigma32)